MEKITFPHIGPVHLIAGLIFKELGIPVVIPPDNSIETLEKGKEISPEEMCLPFKFMAGNLIEAYERGAGRVIMAATMGPCRLGEYGELLKEVLNQNGYYFEWILIDSPSAIGTREWIKRIRRAVQGKKVSYFHAVCILLKSVLLLRKLDQFEAKGKALAGYAVTPRNCVTIQRQCRKQIESATTIDHAFKIIKKYNQQLEELEVNKEVTIQIRVTGEIYTAIEPFANQNIEELLMNLGCSVKRQVTLSWWIGRSFRLFERKQKYLPYNIGGFAKETVTEVSNSKDDGIIKLMPTGCMPEIVAKAACNKISEEKGTKILHLVFDEMKGSAGYETRVEAFIDMLERRRNVLLGDRRRINQYRSGGN